MPLDYFTGKYYKFPFVEKQILKDFFLSNDIDKWGFFTLLVPTKEKKDILLMAIVNKLSVFDRIEDEFLAEEIDITEYAKAAKWYGIEYSPFYPSADISFLSS